MCKEELLIIFGGKGMEYYVSCRTVSNLVPSLDSEKYNVHLIGITKQGEWLLTKASPEEISDGTKWLEREDNLEAVLSLNEKDKSFIVFNDDKYKKVKIDVVLPLMHGYGGEDGRLQGVLDFSGIPYVGAGVATSACSMDKGLTALFAEECGLTLPKSVSILMKEYYENPNKCIDLVNSMKYPLFVKPATGGSSVGVSRVKDEFELKEAIDYSFKVDNKVVIEEEVKGTEIKVALLGNDNPKAGAICELFTQDGKINDYQTKYSSDPNIHSEKHIPAKLDKDIENRIIHDAKAIYRKLDCKGFARVDFFLTPEKELYFNEINTIPGCGNTSIFSVMFDKAGLPFPEMLDELISTAKTK